MSCAIELVRYLIAIGAIHRYRDSVARAGIGGPVRSFTAHRPRGHEHEGCGITTLQWHLVNVSLVHNLAQRSRFGVDHGCVLYYVHLLHHASYGQGYFQIRGDVDVQLNSALMKRGKTIA